MKRSTLPSFASITLLLSTILLAPPLLCQTLDTKGKEFWVTFPTNAGSGTDAETSQLRLYIACDRPTTAMIEYRPDEASFMIDVPRANSPVEVNIDSLFGPQIELGDVEKEGEISQKSLRITSPDDISVHGLSRRQMSSDAFMALPVDLLSRRYLVHAYPNGYNNGGYPKEIDMPSQFAVLATEDGTTVTVTPSALISGHGDLVTFSVDLNAGDVFFAQAQLSAGSDLTCTDIRSTKPVAVFAGTKRASVPISLGNFRDYLVEQIPPLDVWGTEAIIAPFFLITPQSPHKGLARIICEAESVEWTLDGAPQPTLQRGMPVEIDAMQPHHIVASDRILVAQFEHSVGNVETEGGGFALGDPFMTLVPAREQYDRAYAFQSIDHPEFLQHFISVTIPTEAVLTLRLDGGPLTGGFLPVPGTSMSHGQIPVGPGPHFLTADSAFGLCVYGYGRATSYGYIGGMTFTRRPLGIHKSEIPTGISLSVAPNPATAGSVIDVRLSLRETVDIEIFDVSGNSVQRLLAPTTLEPGTHAFGFDAASLPIGAYFVRMRVGKERILWSPLAIR